ncbi:MAG: CHAT domain-containing protein [Sphingomonas bacterium]|nr:CHAT domain-containing protein [Sphingomonas bacterium]
MRHLSRRFGLVISVGIAGMMSAAVAHAAPQGRSTPLSTRDSFRLGDAGVLCTAQTKPTDKRLSGMFDRAYLLTCRDAAGPVGSAVSLRVKTDPATLPSALPIATLTCAAPTQVNIDQVGAVTGLKCRDEANKLDYRRYAATRGRNHLIVEGLAGYDPALRLALASLLLDRAQVGVVQVATTEVGDPAAFARTQAGSLDVAGARAEAYARSNGSRFAESAEFFENLAGRDKDDNSALAEALANQGLQQSNLGNFGAAARLLARADAAAPARDGVAQRLARNYRAINNLNQRDPASALTDLDKPVAPVAEDEENAEIRTGTISIPMAALINRESASVQQLAQLGANLTASERAAVLDAQASELRGIAFRQQGKLADAEARLVDAAKRIAKVRDGRVRSTGWLRSEIEVERALVAEARGDHAAANTAFDRAIAMLGEAFPDSPALLSARARKAGFLVRSGDTAGARAMFDAVVKDSGAVADSSGALRGLLGPYFELLARGGSGDDAAAMFRAAQIMQRPGVAQTQAILARQMSEGNDEASALFRLAVTRAREILRADAEVTRLTTIAAPTERERAALTLASANRDSLRGDQTRISARLADYPRYKVLSPSNVDLADLRRALREGEGYYKMMVVDDVIYALYATAVGARAMKLDLGAGKLNSEVGAVRDSIARYDAKGQLVTEPFDLGRARALYGALFGPVDGEVSRLRHLVFEPDGAMLQLPPYVLVTKQAGVDAYRRRLARPGGDEYDFTGIDWLGRGREVSISVSPRSFLDMRAIAPSRAANAYLGIGHNALAVARPTMAVADDCDWPIQTWQTPISPDELVLGQAVFGAGNSRLVTGAAFTDTALLADKKLSDYKILHFATHGLVTAPRPDCPARPALVTSFAADGSDGLLSFKEIFDLKLDADVVILSACDTAGAASASASREAGITGGNYALDGLVRAFVGAGARSVVASHWPVPDNYDATKRLVGGLLRARPGQALAQALGEAQRGLMDDPRTSHPFYWAAFIILGDGAKPLVSAAPQRVAAVSASR